MALDENVLRRLVDGLAELYAPLGADSYPERACSVLSRLIPVESCSYNEFAGTSLRSYLVEPAEVMDFPGALELFAAHLPEHPVLRHYAQTEDGTGQRISDFLSDRQFRVLGLYREFYRPAATEYQLAATLSGRSGVLIAVALNRTGRNFSDEHVELVNLLRPHLGQAYATARALSEPWTGRPQAAGGMPLLTPRQARILQLVADGLPDNVIARSLGISHRTVHAHLQHIYRTLDVRSRTEAVAQLRGLLLAGSPTA
jgi:DNA-binding CsgD family transcriptional regulator